MLTGSRVTNDSFKINTDQQQAYVSKGFLLDQDVCPAIIQKFMFDNLASRDAIDMRDDCFSFHNSPI